MNYPIYRKYTNSETYFKIVSEDEFEEVQFIGDKPILHSIKAVQYPEKLRIMDMTNCLDGIWVEITAEIYEAKKSPF